MQKKLQLLSMSTLLVTMNIAVPAFAQFTLSLGVQATRMDVESHSERAIFLPPQAGGDVFFNDSENNEDTSIGGELAAGYQFNFENDLNIAFEIFGQLSDAQVKTPMFANGSAQFITGGDIPAHDATASFDWIAGLRMRPGYYLTSATRLFLDAGIVWGGFELKQSEELIDYFDAELSHHFPQTETQTLLGWRYGAGVEYKLTHSFVIGLDYTITQFETFHSDSVDEFIAVLNPSFAGTGVTIEGASEFKPTLQTAGLNFKYLFGTQKIKPPQRFYEIRDK